MRRFFTFSVIFATLTIGAFAQNFSIRKIAVPKDFIGNGIAIDEQGNFYAATFGLLRSTDKGASWKIFGSIKQDEDVVPIISTGSLIDDLTFTGGSRLYGNISDVGVYSEDKGATWLSLYSNNSIKIIGHIGDTLYGKSADGLSVLAPGSQTWVKHANIGDFDAQFVYGMKNGFELALGYGQFRAYVPTLGQWKPGSFTGMNEAKFSAAADIGFTIWIGSDLGLYQVNAATQFVNQITFPGVPNNTPVITDVISVGDTAVYVATGSYGVFGSSDLGATWKKIADNEEISNATGLAWYQGGLYVTSATGIYRLQTGASTEIENLTNNADMTLGKIGFLGDKALFTSVTELYTGSGGDWTSSWSKLSVPLNEGIYVGAPFVIGNNLYVAKSYFLASWNGETLTKLNADFYDLNDVVPSKDGTIWALDQTVLRRSVDGGATFADAGPATVPIYYGVWPNQLVNSVLISTDDGLYATEDAGASWGKIQFSVDESEFTNALFYGDTIMIAASSGKIYYTEDFGVNWSEITPDSSAEFPFYWQVNNFVRGKDGVVYMATNVGLFYRLTATSPFVRINKPEFADMPSYYAGANATGDLYFGFMNGIYKVTHTGMGVSIEKASTITFAPNPARESIRILSAETPIRAEIYSAAGGLQLSVNSPEREISIGGLPPGAYILKFYTASGAETQLFVKE